MVQRLEASKDEAVPSLKFHPTNEHLIWCSTGNTICHFDTRQVLLLVSPLALRGCDTEQCLLQSNILHAICTGVFATSRYSMESRCARLDCHCGSADRVECSAATAGMHIS